MDNIQRPQDSNTVTIPANTTTNAVIDARISANPPLTNGSVNAQFLFVTASNFTATANGSGDNFTIGDDVKIGDVNISNTLGLKGIQDPTQGYIKFGTTGPVFGFASSAALPVAGTAVTGSLIQKGSNLYFYNGQVANGGWATVI
jgi:hypothetical protein